MLRFGIVEKLLMTYQTARTPQIRKEAARLLCKISKHGTTDLRSGEYLVNMVELRANRFTRV